MATTASSGIDNSATGSLSTGSRSRVQTTALPKGAQSIFSTDNVQILEADLCYAPAMSSLGTRVFTESFGHSLPLPPDELAAFLAVAYSAEAFEAEMRKPHITTWIARGDSSSGGDGDGDGDGDADADADVTAAPQPLLGYVHLVRGVTDASLGAANDTASSGQELAQLHRLYVDVAVHGRGIGTKLAAVAEDRARSEGFEKLWLTVWEDNVKAQRLYERLGFVKVGMADFVVGTCVLRDWVMVQDLGR